ASISASTSASTVTSASDTMSTSTSVSTSESTSTSGSTNSRPQEQETTTKSRQELPNTGEKQSVKSGLLGLILGLTGLGLVAKRRKRDDED
ncbi:TPA: LPXTG cell wall anchor domain-containing protein, partial [Streptococcus pneumoniae]|nr:LPXTG cell wall anchor domain-containing protein [Streptococcus pneumoniae]HEV6961339.1 LPXTG cell wall anchor domain-containing protein [Streptococcus pneumoniae]HEV6976521.1 LPXTG cell wall anchor domain-containing protein [Streptococcus pneumoniae]